MKKVLLFLALCAAMVMAVACGTKADPLKDVVDGLKDGQAYSYVEIGGNGPALLVADETFDNGDGLAAIEARVYSVDADGNLIDNETVASGGTANPLAVKDGSLYYGGHHFIAKASIDDTGRLLVDEGLHDTEEEMEQFNAVYDEFLSADIVLFTVVGQ